MNNITLIGRLTKDVELKFLSTGVAIATFTIAVDRNYKNKKGETETDFIPIQIVGKMAETTAKYIGKGSLVAINGSLRIDRYKKDNETKSFTKVDCNIIKFLDTKKEEKKEETQFMPNFDLSELELEEEECPF